MAGKKIGPFKQKYVYFTLVIIVIAILSVIVHEMVHAVQCNLRGGVPTFGYATPDQVSYLGIFGFVGTIKTYCSVSHLSLEYITNEIHAYFIQLLFLFLVIKYSSKIDLFKLKKKGVFK